MGLYGPFSPTPALSGGLLWKTPWRLSSRQKFRQRKRLKAVDTVVATLDTALRRQAALATPIITPDPTPRTARAAAAAAAATAATGAAGSGAVTASGGGAATLSGDAAARTRTGADTPAAAAAAAAAIGGVGGVGGDDVPAADAATITSMMAATAISSPSAGGVVAAAGTAAAPSSLMSSLPSSSSLSLSQAPLPGIRSTNPTWTVRAIERWKAEMPTEAEMLPRDKYTIFDRHAKKYRKSIHKLPKWTRVSQRINPPGY